MTRITKSKFLITAGLTALLCVLLSPGARADGTGLGDVTITLPTISGSAGDTIVVLGSLANSSSNTLDFTNDFVSASNPTVLTGLGDVFFNSLLSTGPGSINGNSTLTGVDLFTIFIASDAIPGLYVQNTYVLEGGPDASCSGLIADPSLCSVQLASVNFTVNVQGAVPTPEPGTLLLLASGLLAGLLGIRRAAQ
jgi:PEP-CTERM motif